MMRGLGLDIGVPHLVEHLVAEIGVQQFVIVAQRVHQPRAIGVAIDAEQRLALLLRAVENFPEHLVIAGEDAALKIVLLPREIARHAGASSTAEAISRARATSTSNSSSGGMLSSRSIMVETLPKRFSAAL